MPTEQADKLLAFLEERRDAVSPLLIVAHDYPDPDALASALALQHLGRAAYGITSRIVYGGVIGRTENRAMVDILKIPAYKLKPSDFKKYNNYALIDTQPAFKNNSFPVKKKATIVIDQHPSDVKPLADFSIVDPDCGATAVILAQALLNKGIDIPSRVATALAYGILSDTMNLYRARHADIIDTYLNILPFCDLRALARIQNPVRSRKFFSILGKGIQNAKSRRGLIVVHLGNVENPDLVSQVADFLLSYRQATRALSTGRYHGKLYVSLRLSKGGTNASEILRDVLINRGNAGGHDTIAGGSFRIAKAEDPAAWQEAEESLEKRLLKRLRIPSRGEFHYPFR